VVDSDTTLVARVAAEDDRSAFELLVRRHQSSLRNFLRRLTQGDVGRADDLAQETFVKAYRSIASFEGVAQFKTWLYRIAYHSFLNDERTRIPVREFSEADLPADVDFSDEADMARDVDSALKRLSIRQQAVFDLHFKKGMTHSEVAQSLDLALGTVKSDLTRGRARLRDILERWGYE
jgi:RNA polymerase sigma factor (sigma-70 family)